MFVSVAVTFLLAFRVDPVSPHGYVKNPRSRNWVAAEDGPYWGGTSIDPFKEYCPHCLNRGGPGAECGLVDSRNYNFPPNAVGGLMPTNIQAEYAVGAEVDFDIVLTAHHLGHFEFHACSIPDGGVPDQDCFDGHPLEFVEDLLYGAPQDPSFPGRAYIPPLTYSGIITDSSGPVPGTLYRYRLKLPSGLEGSLVLLQWHYLSANSCVHAGYDTYNFPAAWGSMGYSALSECTSIPIDGDGVPEQFWNCVEVSVGSPGGTTPAPSPDPATAEPTVAPTTSGPSAAPTSAAPTTAAPVEAPVTPPPVETVVLSTESRCGISELDARGNCGSICAGQADCQAGEWCWAVQVNYCGTRPGFGICNDLSKANGLSRCGVTELDARELCGILCTDNSGCPSGEFCFPTHLNTCDCVQSGQRTLLRGSGGFA